MKFNTKTILLILVVFLLGTNIAVITNFWLHKQSEATTVKSKIEIPDKQFGLFFSDELNLNDDQQERFREFRRKYNRSANQTLSELQEIRNEMASTLKTVYPDRKRLDKLGEELGEKHRELKGLTFDYYFNMQRILDEGQQEKMVEIFQAMLTETGDVKTPMPGGNGHQGQGLGRGQGWRTVSDTIQNISK